LLSVPVQVIAWRTVSELTYNVSSGTLNLTHSLTHSLDYCDARLAGLPLHVRFNVLRTQRPDWSPIASTSSSQAVCNNYTGFRCNTASPINCVYWCIWFARHRGLTENDGHEIDGHEIDGPSVQAW